MHPMDPRQTPNHHERGPRRFSYTYEDIAAAATLSPNTVKAYACASIFDARDLRSVSAFIQRHAAAAARKVRDDELSRLFAQRDARLWLSRWPRFDLYWCIFSGCAEACFEPGGCFKHGGSPRPFAKFSSVDKYILLLVDQKHVPYHRLVVNAPRALHVHHRDENRWNNRPENLLVLTPEEHMKQHRGARSS